MSSTIQILIADDDPEDRFIISDSFGELGYSDVINFAESGVDALQYLNSIKDANNLPVLIVLDLNMPRLNGTETLRQIKNDDALKAIPVIIFSTSINEIEREQCIALGAASYLTKPNNYKESLQIAKHFYDFAVECTSR